VNLRLAFFSLSFLLASGADALPLPKFPAGAVWNRDVSAPSLKHAQSDRMIAWLQSHGGWGTGLDHFQIDFSMSVLHADAGSPTADVIGYPYDDYYLPDCDEPGTVPFPLPAGGSIEGSGDYSCDNGNEDCHLLVVRGNELFESYHSNRTSGGLESQCAVRWDLSRVYPPQGRGEQCTSVDAAGFPVAPLLFNADEVYAAIQAHGDIGHAIRFILPNDEMKAGVYVRPATHAGGPENEDAYAIPYGSRLRLKADFDIDAFSDNEAVRAILRTLKKYGMVLADGGRVPLTAEVDTYTTHKWDEPAISMDSHSLFGIEPDDFEVVATDAPIELTYDCVREPEGNDPPPPEAVFQNGFDPN
jgi:serine/threonine-protein kinase